MKPRLRGALLCALLSSAPALGQTYLDSSGTIVSGVVPVLPGVGPVGSNASPLTTRQASLVWTQTIVTLPAGVSTPLVAANPNRRALRWMVTGASPMTVAPGSGAVVAGQGMNYSGAAAPGQQGGADSFAGEISTQAFSAISTQGTTVAVWEGQ